MTRTACKRAHLWLGMGLMMVCVGASSAKASGDVPSVAEQYLLNAANEERAARGLKALRMDPVLRRAASAHAAAMAVRGDISHQFSGELGLSARAAKAGARFSVISENVGEAGSALVLHEMWMKSAGHRENLLDPAIDSAGISVVSSGGQLYAVEDFAKTVALLTPEEQESSVAALLAVSQGLVVDRNLKAVADARATCGMATGYAGERRPGFVMRYSSDRLTDLPQQLTTRLASGRFREAVVGSCDAAGTKGFSAYSIAVLLYP